MKKIIIVAGYIHSDRIKELLNDIRFDSYELWCVYGRDPVSPVKQNYLKLFTKVFSLQDFLNGEYCSRDNVATVLCTQERDMETFIEIQEFLRKISPHTANLYRSCIDKEEMKVILSKSNPELVPKIYTTETLTNESLFPVVAKPTGLSGSSFVKIINNHDELEKYENDMHTEINERSNSEYDHQSRILYEEFVTGTLLSVNVFISPDGPIIFCPTMKVIPAFELEGTDTYSAIQHLHTQSPEEEHELHASICTVIKTFNLSGTAAHFDIIQSEKGYKFIEIGLRIGGLRQEYFKISHNTNHFLNDVLVRIGEKVVKYTKETEVSIVQKASSKTGTLKDIVYPDNTLTNKASKIILHKSKGLGIHVSPLNTGGITLIRYFLVNDSLDELIKDSKRLFDEISFEVEE